MAKLFETSWRKDYNYFERVYDTVTDRTQIHKINLVSEWFEEDSRGKYVSILDDSIKLSRNQGNAKDGREHWGFIDPIYRNIRDKYWNEVQQNTYNKSPRIFYLDIETRVGRSWKHETYGNETITVKHNSNNTEILCTVDELRNAIYDDGEDLYKFYDTIEKKWLNLSKSTYFERNTGFPVPEKSLEEISLIQIFDTKLDTLFVFGTKEWKHQSNYTFNYKVQYVKCQNEEQLIDSYIKVFTKLNPLIIYAWNGRNFDYPYLYNRMKKIGMDPNKLSTQGKVQLKEKTLGHRVTYNLEAIGHHYMDLLEIYQKFTFGEQASYSLDFTAELILNEKKVPHPEYVGFDDFYTGKYVIPLNPSEEQKNSLIYKEAIAGNWAEVKELAHSDFVYYGCKDTMLIKGIDDAKNLTALIFMIAEKMGVLLSDSLGTVKPWSKYIANKALLTNKVIPKVHKSEEDISIKGGYVRQPEIGKHNWVMSSDVNSMYPLLGMVGFNMSPETHIPIHKLPSDLREIILRSYNNEDEEKRFDIPKNQKTYVSDLLTKNNYSMGVNGAIFDRNQIGMVPEMIQDIYATRKQEKKNMFKYEQKAVDIRNIINEQL